MRARPIMVTWKNVFNTSLRVPLYGHIDEAQKAADAAGYPFFIWNDRVYETKTLKETGGTPRGLSKLMYPGYRGDHW